MAGIEVKHIDPEWNSSEMQSSCTAYVLGLIRHTTIEPGAPQGSSIGLPSNPRAHPVSGPYFSEIIPRVVFCEHGFPIMCAPIRSNRS